MKKLLMTVAVSAIACGCVTINKNDGGDAKVAPNVVKDAIHEQYQVGKETVTAQDQVNCLFGFICWGSTATHIADSCDSGSGPIGKAKNGAYANACDAGKCDVIVGAKYTVKTSDYFIFRRAQASITGYPATLTGVEVIPVEKLRGLAAQSTCTEGPSDSSPVEGTFKAVGLGLKAVGIGL